VVAKEKADSEELAAQLAAAKAQAEARKAAESAGAAEDTPAAGEAAKKPVAAASGEPGNLTLAQRRELAQMVEALEQRRKIKG
jgi:hypothetical protein